MNFVANKNYTENKDIILQKINGTDMKLYENREALLDIGFYENM